MQKQANQDFTKIGNLKVILKLVQEKRSSALCNAWHVQV